MSDPQSPLGTLNDYGVTSTPHLTNGRSYSTSAPADSTGYSPTGESLSIPWEGNFDALRGKACELIQEATPQCHISAHISEGAGSIAKMTVTYTWYTPSGGGSGSEGTVAAVGSTRENPEYAFDVGKNDISILFHPRIYNAWADFTDTQRLAIQAWAKGGALKSMFTNAEGYKEYIQSALDHTIVSDFVRDDRVRTIRVNTLTARVSYAVPPETAVAALQNVNKIQAPPGFLGKINFGSGRNWLFATMSYSLGPNGARCNEVYELSDPGGWDPEIYGSAK